MSIIQCPFVIAIGILVSFVISGISSSVFREALGVPDFNILAVGNWGCNQNSQQTADNMRDKTPELVLGLGDYSYQSTPKCWLDKIKPIDNKTKINSGNHDVITKKLLNSYLDHFDLSKQYYSFNFKNVHYSYNGKRTKIESGLETVQFVKNDLQQASKDPKIKWIIVNMHKPVYTSPNGCSASSCKGSVTLRDIYHPLFDQYGVDLVLGAHMHSYQRTFPFKYNTDNPSEPAIISSSKNNYNNPNGVIFAIVGTGGINFHGLAGRAPFVASQQRNKFGALEIKITNGVTIIEGKFYANDESKKDQFTIKKSGGVLCKGIKLGFNRVS